MENELNNLIKILEDIVHNTDWNYKDIKANINESTLEEFLSWFEK